MLAGARVRGRRASPPGRVAGALRETIGIGRPLTSPCAAWTGPRQVPEENAVRSTRLVPSFSSLVPTLLFLVELVALPACSVSFPVVAGMDAYNEVLRGTGTSNLRGSGSFAIQGQVTKVRCTGEAVVTQRTGGFGCAGQRGRTVFVCDDGRHGEGEYTVTSCGSGFGMGLDSEGNRVWFAFGMSEPEAADRARRALELAATRPGLPTYKPSETRRERGFATGTGFFVTGEGHVLTNLHVVQDARVITVVAHDRKRREALLVASDPANDVAVLKVEPGGGRPPLGILLASR